MTLEYEEVLQRFLNQGWVEDEQYRLKLLTLLYSDDRPELKMPNSKSISETEWRTLLVLVCNYLNSNSVADWESFFNYFNRFSGEDDS